MQSLQDIQVRDASITSPLPPYKISSKHKHLLIFSVPAYYIILNYINIITNSF